MYERGTYENITSESNVETGSVFNEAETSPMVYYEDIVFGTLVEDEAMLQRAKSHIVESNKLYTELLVSYPIDQNQSIVIDDMWYYLVDMEGVPVGIIMRIVPWNSIQKTT